MYRGHAAGNEGLQGKAKQPLRVHWSGERKPYWQNHVGKIVIFSEWRNPLTCTNMLEQPAHLHILTITTNVHMKLQPSTCNTCACANIPVQTVRVNLPTWFPWPWFVRGWRNIAEIILFEISNSMKPYPSYCSRIYQQDDASDSCFWANKSRWGLQPYSANLSIWESPFFADCASQARENRRRCLPSLFLKHRAAPRAREKPGRVYMYYYSRLYYIML